MKKAYAKGYKAYRNKISLQNNPYDIFLSLPQLINWESGWYEAWLNEALKGKVCRRIPKIIKINLAHSFNIAYNKSYKQRLLTNN